MAKKVLYCDDCDVEFKVQFGMSENHYHARHCVFCGGEINIDDEDEECPNDVCYDCNCYEVSEDGC